MKKKMRKKRRSRKCLNCRTYFIPYSQVKGQQFCSEPACQAASHRLSSKRHRKKLKDDPQKWEAEKSRVRKYQHEHPDYKKKQRENKKVEKKSLPADVLRDLYQGETTVNLYVLRDLLFRLIFINKGFMSHYFDVLRDNIDELEVILYNKGSALFRDVLQTSEPLKKGACHEDKKSYTSGSSPPVT